MFAPAIYSNVFVSVYFSESDLLTGETWFNVSLSISPQDIPESDIPANQLTALIKICTDTNPRCNAANKKQLSHKHLSDIIYGGLSKDT